MAARFSHPLLLSEATSRQLPKLLAKHDIAGGATYDAMIALTALEHGCALATRDARAKTTYDTLGVTVDVVA
jgi:predicted nucleic acid-binding protein